MADIPDIVYASDSWAVDGGRRCVPADAGWTMHYAIRGPSRWISVSVANGTSDDLPRRRRTRRRFSPGVTPGQSDVTNTRRENGSRYRLDLILRPCEPRRAECGIRRALPRA